LREQALRRIGPIEAAMVTNRFFRQPQSDVFPGAAVGITLRATVEHAGESGNPDRRLSGATIWGISNWQFPQRIQSAEAWLTAADAVQLGVRVGDTISLRVAKHADIPRESLLGRRSETDTSQRLTATVAGILEASSPIGDFSLAPGTERPHNVFVDLAWLQEQLGEPKRINVLLASGQDPADLQRRLASILTLDDWGLVLRTPSSRTNALFTLLDRNKDGVFNRANGEGGWGRWLSKRRMAIGIGR
jgi:hypothetical protein